VLNSTSLKQLDCTATLIICCFRS